MEVINKYNVALNKIELVLDNVEVIYQQGLAMVVKDLNGKISVNKEVKDEQGKVVKPEETTIEVGTDQADNNIDNQENEEDELGEEEDRGLGTEDYSKTSLEVNPKSSITSTLRRFMKGIPEISAATGLPKKGAMGVQLYVDFDTVYDVVQSILADTPVDFKTMMDVLKLNQDKQPWIPELIKRLEESSNEVKNQFTTTMGKHALTMEFLMYTFDANGNVKFTVYNTNSSSIKTEIGNQWMNTFKTSGVLVNDYDEVEEQVVNELLGSYNSWLKNPSSISSVNQLTLKNKVREDEKTFTVKEGDNLHKELNKSETKSKLIIIQQ
jgi:hypothetical protein